MPLALKIAWRYLTSPKSHGTVSAISIISVVGVAVATAAIVIVLSVFNGFRLHLNSRLDTLTADVSISPSRGKTIVNADSLAMTLENLPGVSIAMPSISDNALVIANSREMPIMLRGIYPEQFSIITSIDTLLLDGNPIANYNPSQSSLSVGVAQRLGIYSIDEEIVIFAPRRIGRINTANPATSFLSDSLQVSSVFRSLQDEFDDNTIFCDISTARNLFQYDTEATSLEIKASDGYDISRLTTELSEFLGEDFIVKDRFRQQEVNFRMVSVEKWLTFLLLAFILLIASFNIIATLCMLIVEKQNSLTTLSDIGMSRRQIGAVFWWESILVTLSGAVSGIVIGVILSLLQEKFSLIKLAGDPETLIITAYPVAVEWVDLAITCIPIAIIGIITAFISRSFAISLVRQNN